MENEHLRQTAPLMFLMTRNPGNMTDEELIAHENQLRALSTSAQTKRATITKEPKQKKNWDYLLKPQDPS